MSCSCHHPVVIMLSPSRRHHHVIIVSLPYMPSSSLLMSSSCHAHAIVMSCSRHHHVFIITSLLRPSPPEIPKRGSDSNLKSPEHKVVPGKPPGTVTDLLLLLLLLLRRRLLQSGTCKNTGKLQHSWPPGNVSKPEKRRSPSKVPDTRQQMAKLFDRQKVHLRITACRK